MASIVYNSGKSDFLDGTNDWDSASTFNCLLATTTYVPDPDHNFVSQVTNELSGGGYVRKAVTTRTVFKDLTNDRADIKGDNITWTALTGTPRYAIVYKLVTVDSDSRLICCIDLTAQSLSAVDFTIKWDAQAANGAIARLT